MLGKERGREPGGGGYTFGVLQANARCTAGWSQHEEGTWAWKGVSIPWPHPSPPSNQVTPALHPHPHLHPHLHLQDDHHHPNSPHPPPALRENLIDAHDICAHHPSTPPVIDEPRGCTAPFYFSICIIGLLISWECGGGTTTAGGPEAPAGHGGGGRSRPCPGDTAPALSTAQDHVMQSVPGLKAHATDGPHALPGRSAALWAVEGCVLKATSLCSCHPSPTPRDRSELAQDGAGQTWAPLDHAPAGGEGGWSPAMFSWVRGCQGLERNPRRCPPLRAGQLQSTLMQLHVFLFLLMFGESFVGG